MLNMWETMLAPASTNHSEYKGTPGLTTARPSLCVGCNLTTGYGLIMFSNAHQLKRRPTVLIKGPSDFAPHPTRSAPSAIRRHLTVESNAGPPMVPFSNHPKVCEPKNPPGRRSGQLEVCQVTRTQRLQFLCDTRSCERHAMINVAFLRGPCLAPCCGVCPILEANMTNSSERLRSRVSHVFRACISSSGRICWVLVSCKIWLSFQLMQLPHLTGLSSFGSFQANISTLRIRCWLLLADLKPFGTRDPAPFAD